MLRDRDPTMGILRFSSRVDKEIFVTGRKEGPLGYFVGEVDLTIPSLVRQHGIIRQKRIQIEVEFFHLMLCLSSVLHICN